MNIRPATVADINALLELQKDAPTASQWSAEQYRGATSSSEPTRLTLVVEESSKLQGFLVARKVEGEWEIENVVVAASVRRRGLGTRLLDEFFNTARVEHAKAVFLEVRESNSAARHLYERVGFQEIGRRQLYYQAPAEDAILYRLELP